MCINIYANVWLYMILVLMETTNDCNSDNNNCCQRKRKPGCRIYLHRSPAIGHWALVFSGHFLDTHVYQTHVNQHWNNIINM